MDSGLFITPETGIEIPTDIPLSDVAQRAKAACESIRLLEQEGLDPQITDCEEDEAMAALIAEAYLFDPEDTSKQLTDTRFGQLSTNTVQLVNEILNNYSMLVAKKAEHLRNLVINKLVILSDDDDKRIQLRALEDIGKIGEVGLFTDRKDVHVTHHNLEETRQQLRDRLIDLKKQADGTYSAIDDENPTYEEIAQATE